MQENTKVVVEDEVVRRCGEGKDNFKLGLEIL